MLYLIVLIGVMIIYILLKTSFRNDKSSDASRLRAMACNDLNIKQFETSHYNVDTVYPSEDNDDKNHHDSIDVTCDGE